MKKLPFPLIISVLFLWVASAAAQDNSCPSLNIASPNHVLPKGERGTYLANIDTKGKSLTLEYLWSASSSGQGGEQKLGFEGQGTSQITVVFPERGNSVFVTLKVKGFPEGCPSDASDAIIVDLAPEATKLIDVQPGAEISNREIEEAVSLLNDHPNDALFILNGHMSGKPSKSDPAGESKIIRLLTDAGLSRERITLQDVEADRELLQLWMVPPGANTPKCDICEKPESAAKRNERPKVSLVGPEGITQLGELVVVTAQIANFTQNNLSYRWSVEGADTFSGQNTSKITIDTPKPTNFDGINLRVTLEVSGLPDGCPNSVSEEYPTYALGDRFPLDQYGEVSFTEERARLDNLAIQVLQTSEFKGYIVKTFKSGTSQRSIEKKLIRIRNFMFTQRKYPLDRFEILVKMGERTETILHREPPNEGSSLCSDCEPISVFLH